MERLIKQSKNLSLLYLIFSKLVDEGLIGKELDIADVVVDTVLCPALICLLDMQRLSWIDSFEDAEAAKIM